MSVSEFMNIFAPLSRMKNPGLAAVLGFVLGGVGLGIYFRSFIDFIIPIALVIAASVLSTGFANLDPSVGTFAGAIVASMWGYLRVENSNRRLTGAETAGKTVPQVPLGI